MSGAYREEREPCRACARREAEDAAKPTPLWQRMPPILGASLLALWGMLYVAVKLWAEVPESRPGNIEGASVAIFVGLLAGIAVIVICCVAALTAPERRP